MKYSESYHLHISSQLSQCWSSWTPRGRSVAFAAPGPCRRHFAGIHSMSWHCECHLSGSLLEVWPFCPSFEAHASWGTWGWFELYDKHLRNYQEGSGHKQTGAAEEAANPAHKRIVIEFSWGLHVALQMTMIPSHWQGSRISVMFISFSCFLFHGQIMKKKAHLVQNGKLMKPPLIPPLYKMETPSKTWPQPKIIYIMLYKMGPMGSRFFEAVPCTKWEPQYHES